MAKSFQTWVKVIYQRFLFIWMSPCLVQVFSCMYMYLIPIALLLYFFEFIFFILLPICLLHCCCCCLSVLDVCLLCVCVPFLSVQNSCNSPVAVHLMYRNFVVFKVKEYILFKKKNNNNNNETTSQTVQLPACNTKGKSNLHQLHVLYSTWFFKLGNKVYLSHNS